VCSSDLSSLRLDIRKIGVNKQGDQIIGNRIRVKVVKNKVAPPFRTAEFDIFFDEGVSRTTSVLDVGTEMNLIEKSGTWFTYNEEKLGQGRDNARNFLRENPKILDEIENKIREKISTAPLPAQEPSRN
jgi:recombination protein RecA